MFYAEDLDGTYSLRSGPGTLTITSNGLYSGMFTIRNDIFAADVYGVVEYDPASNYIRFIGSEGILSYSSVSQPDWKYNGYRGRWEASINHFTSIWEMN
jgi:hypothetical protein